ncbi:MAG TPA: multiheme c-type cytochrome [Candidatus Hypogeohydataceae bacterium YC40]
MLPFPINLSIKWLIPFLVFSCGLVAVSLIWVFRETWRVDWKIDQKREFVQMGKDMESKLKILEDPQWGDPKKAALVRSNLEYLKRPQYQVKQILLKGEGNWKQGTSGVRVDRCMTCHINEDKLIKQHPYTAEDFPFDIYGCTACHEGNGRALKKELAHEHLFKNKKDMYRRLVHPEDAIKFWKNLAGLSIQEGLDASDFRYFNVTGEPQAYIGSTTCIKCHKKLTPYHVDFWAQSKFKTFEKVKTAKDFIEGDEDYRKQCYKCHTTGYNEKTGEFNEENVTCEACHGPGELYAQFMSTGKLAAAATLTRETFSFKVCGRCHIPRNHEMRWSRLLAMESKELADSLQELEGISKELGEMVCNNKEKSASGGVNLGYLLREEKVKPEAHEGVSKSQKIDEKVLKPEANRDQIEISTKG